MQKVKLLTKRIYSYLAQGVKLAGIVSILILILPVPTKISAATANYRSVFSAANCSISSGAATVTSPQRQEFMEGKGIDVAGIGTIYRSTSLYHCCYDQLSKGQAPTNCNNVFATQVTNNKDPWFSSSQGDIYVKFGTIP